MNFYIKLRHNIPSKCPENQKNLKKIILIWEKNSGGKQGKQGNCFPGKQGNRETALLKIRGKQGNRETAILRIGGKQGNRETRVFLKIWNTAGDCTRDKVEHLCGHTYCKSCVEKSQQPNFLCAMCRMPIYWPFKIRNVT